MKHHIKCPNCSHEFEVKIDDATPPDTTREIVIAPCCKCGAPLVNFNNADAWKVLEVSDLDKVPAEIKEQITILLMVNALKNPAGGLASQQETPFTRARFFLAGTGANSEGCVVLMKDDPDEWKPFATVCGYSDDVSRALLEIHTKEYNQNIEEN